MEPMSLDPTSESVLSAAIKGWFRTFAGINAIDVARDLPLPHEEVLRIFEDLSSKGHGSINADVQLFQVSLDPSKPGAGFEFEPVRTHIFFPAKEALRKAFFASDLPEKRLSEYTTRLHLGAQQISLVYFSEEVLARYLDRPDFYEINDTLSGGDASSSASAPSDRSLYVRYGKCRMHSGEIAVTAIYKDLSSMSPAEQRHWHSHELDHPKPVVSDRHFQSFLGRTYDGAFVEYEDPISHLLESLGRLNQVLAKPLFVRLQNVHLHLPVEQTYKSYCDAASELYKVVGPDNISQSRLRELLLTTFGVQPQKLKHEESGRPLSTLQMIELLESSNGEPGLLTNPLRGIAALRVEADHKVLGPDPNSRSYSRDFASKCAELSEAVERFTDKLESQAS